MLQEHGQVVEDLHGARAQLTKLQTQLEEQINEKDELKQLHDAAVEKLKISGEDLTVLSEKINTLTTVAAEERERLLQELEEAKKNPIVKLTGVVCIYIYILISNPNNPDNSYNPDNHVHRRKPRF